MYRISAAQCAEIHAGIGVVDLVNPVESLVALPPAGLAQSAENVLPTCLYDASQPSVNGFAAVSKAPNPNAFLSSPHSASRLDHRRPIHLSVDAQ
jgi:hypothetical protein